MRFFKKKQKDSRIVFKLSVDFGYSTSSPIPANEPKHNNLHEVVLAIPGTYGELFPGKRSESIEFLDYIEDEKGNPYGIRCKIREYSELYEKALAELGYEQHPVSDLELFADRPKLQEADQFDNGVTTHIYRHYRLERFDEEKEKNRTYWRSERLFHEIRDVPKE